MPGKSKHPKSLQKPSDSKISLKEDLQTRKENKIGTWEGYDLLEVQTQQTADGCLVTWLPGSSPCTYTGVSTSRHPTAVELQCMH